MPIIVKEFFYNEQVKELLPVVEVETEVIWIGGADEVGQVADADRRHAGDAVDDRLLEVAVGQEALICMCTMRQSMFDSNW